MHLQEVRDQIKTMQVDKSSLLQDNTMHEMKIKNLLEELKLTQEAAGDSGTQVRDLAKNLRAAKDRSN